MQKVFVNDTAIAIPTAEPTAISSPIQVAGLDGRIQRVTVSIDLFHTYNSDLRIILIAPNGQEILLVAGEGGSDDNFIHTTFDSDAPTSITTAMPPFTGTFRPEGDLTSLRDIDPNGQWNLRVLDVAYLDGGELSRWTLSLTLSEKTTSQFAIDVRFLGGLTASQRAVFEAAAARWSEIIVGDLPSVTSDSDAIDDVLIEATGVSIDGSSGVLGQAGPTRLRRDSLLPATGIMEFDIGDLARLEANGGLLNVIIHEMGHVLGIGTLWRRKNLIIGAGSANPRFIGTNAMREFGRLLGGDALTPVPVANTGGAGTRDGHWRESVFGSELMTGFLNPGSNPISRLTIASLEDLGYVVNYNAAVPYELPTSLELAMMGIGADNYGHWNCTMCRSHPNCPQPVDRPKLV